jgi:hypothetical protein
MRLSILGTAAVAALMLLHAPHALAEESEANAAIARLLDVGWGTSSQFRTAGDEQAQLVLRVAGRDGKSLYAAALVLIKQGRYSDALKLIDERLAKEGGDLAALRARVWLTTVLRNYSVAMVAAQKLAEALPEKEHERIEEEAAVREYVSFLGRIYGFLGGPAAANVPRDERKASERNILDRLTEGRRVLFEEARDAVLQRHLELTDTGAAKADEAREAAEVAKQKTLEEIAAEREERTARLKELQGRTDKLRQELKAELDAIAREDRPLAAELDRLNIRAGALSRELLLIDGQIGNLQSQLGREENAVIRKQILADIDRLALIVSRYQSDLIAVNRLAARVQAQRAGLAARQAKAQADYSAQIERVNRESAELAKREKRATAIEKRTSRSTPATPASVLSLKAQAGALATYDAFPLEQEKTRLLKSLK